MALRRGLGRPEELFLSLERVVFTRRIIGA